MLTRSATQVLFALVAAMLLSPCLFTLASSVIFHLCNNSTAVLLVNTNPLFANNLEFSQIRYYNNKRCANNPSKKFKASTQATPISLAAKKR